jgi:hypothetical protein
VKRETRERTDTYKLPNLIGLILLQSQWYGGNKGGGRGLRGAAASRLRNEEGEGVELESERGGGGTVQMQQEAPQVDAAPSWSHPACTA